jgi:hypothetical protein
MSEEEGETASVARTGSRVGALAFDQIICSDMKTAIEYQQDKPRGQTEGRKAQGEGLDDDQPITEPVTEAESNARNNLPTS